jgi:hypothetical protein
MTVGFSRDKDRFELGHAILGLSTEIDDLVAAARRLRQVAWSDPERRLTTYALDDMIHLLTEVKLRLRDDARAAVDPARN